MCTIRDTRCHLKYLFFCVLQYDGMSHSQRTYTFSCENDISTFSISLCKDMKLFLTDYKLINITFSSTSCHKSMAAKFPLGTCNKMLLYFNAITARISKLIGLILYLFGVLGYHIIFCKGMDS
eukprot:105950_1